MLTRGCQCGAVRHRGAATPDRICVCHCAECRAQTALAIGFSEIVPRDAMRLPQSALRVWSRATASGKMLACAIDPDSDWPNSAPRMLRVRKMAACAHDPNSGGHMWHPTTSERADMSNTLGSPDARIDLTGTAHIQAIKGVVPSCDARRYLRDHD